MRVLILKLRTYLFICIPNYSSRIILSSSLKTLLVILSFMTACVTDEDEPNSNEDEKEAYEHVLNLQDEVDSRLEDWFTTMDSLEAIKKAQQEFANDPRVSSATISSQGISVQYTNGMRGGIFIDPLDGKTELDKSIPLDLYDNTKSLSKSDIVNQKKMILLNPHYWDRTHYTDQIYSMNKRYLEKVNIDFSTFYKNEESTVDRFTELSGYGIIQIYSHGWAWPKQENITDVYVLTGETENEATSEKYWDDLTEGNIPIVKIFGSHNYYFLSPQFIAENNDFSNDTILFYGGFCYSFLGNWPDIIDEFADGAYTGHDWYVYTYKNANWLVNSIFHLSDTTADMPVTLNDWFNDDQVPKVYWCDSSKKYVNLHYAGDGNLTLWDDVTVRLIPLSPDGTPVNFPGEVGVAYPFKCIINNADTNSRIYDFSWDIGDGNPPISESNEVDITWSESGQYILKVDVIKGDIFPEAYGTASLAVTIGEEDIPQIEHITPSIAKVGEVVQIRGKNFGTSQNNSEVWFGSIIALASDIVSWNDSQIDVKVPLGAVTCEVHVVIDGEESNYVSFTVEEESTPNTGHWVLYDTKEINGCQFYESDCWPLDNCSGSAGNYSITIGTSTCGNDPQPGYSGSGSYTLPPSQFMPGDTLIFDITASSSGYTRVNISYYSDIENMSFDELGNNTGDSPSLWDKIVSCWENSSPTMGKYKISEYPDEDGAILIDCYGSIGLPTTSRHYYFLYKWQE